MDSSAPLFESKEIRVEPIDGGVRVLVPPRYHAVLLIPFVALIGLPTGMIPFAIWLFCRDAVPRLAERGAVELMWFIPILGCQLVLFAVGSVGLIAVSLIILRSLRLRTIDIDTARSEVRLTHLPCGLRVYALSSFAGIYRYSSASFRHGWTHWIYLADDSERKCLMIHFRSHRMQPLSSVAKVMSKATGLPIRAGQNAVAFGTSFFFP